MKVGLYVSAYRGLRLRVVIIAVTGVTGEWMGTRNKNKKRLSYSVQILYHYLEHSHMPIPGH